jgi:hypothetical protein
MSYKNLIAEVLAAHADRLRDLPGKTFNRQNYADLFPNHKDLPILLTLADKVQAALPPVTPSASFKAQLRHDLMAAAHNKQAQPTHAFGLSWLTFYPRLSVAFTMLVTLSIGFFFYRGRQKTTQAVVLE